MKPNYTYMAVGPNCSSMGPTPEKVLEAVKSIMDPASLPPKDTDHCFDVYRCHPETVLLKHGSITHPRGQKPVLIGKYDVRGRFISGNLLEAPDESLLDDLAQGDATIKSTLLEACDIAQPKVKLGKPKLIINRGKTHEKKILARTA